jgi:hypothetical protein
MTATPSVPQVLACSSRRPFARSQPDRIAFAKFKALLRKTEERNIEGLCRRTGRLLEASLPAANYLQNTEYASARATRRLILSRYRAQHL